MTDHPESSGITVVGRGEMSGPPDLATVDLAVSVRAHTVAAAAAEARRAVESVLSALDGAGIERDDVATAGYSIHPEYDHHEGAQRLLGYRVINQIRARARDLTRIGEVIDRCAEAAGDAAVVNDVSFSIEDEGALAGQARESAWADARAKAEHLATLAGRGVGEVISIVESAAHSPGPFPLPRLAAMAESTPIEAGTATIAVTLVVRFGIG